MRLRSLTEALLYRGDAEHIEKFDIFKTDGQALLGAGIYLTTDPDVAHDYTVARGQSRVYPKDRTDPPAKSVRALIRGYVSRLASEGFDERRFRDEWVRHNGLGSSYTGLSAANHRRLDQAIEDARRRSNSERWADAVAQVKRELPSLRVLRMTTGDIVLVRAERPAAISVFNVPDAYLAKTLHADRPLSDRDLTAIKTLWRTFFNKGSDGDLRDGNENFVDFDGYVRNYREKGTRYAWRDEGEDDWWRGGKGENPTLDDLMNGTHAGSHVFKDSIMGDDYSRVKAVRAAMKRLGYVGLEYDGGTRVGSHLRGGGGRRHRAFVFWFPEDLERFRLENAPLPSGDPPSPRAVPPKDLSKLLRTKA